MQDELKFTLDFEFADTPFSTSYELVGRPQSEELLWINEFLIHNSGDPELS